MARRFSYHLEVDDHGAWVRLLGDVGLEYGRGYVAHHRHAPGPRIGLRLVRSDGREMDSASALVDAGVGLIAGWPTAQQYRTAAARCLALAESIEARSSATIEPESESESRR